MIQYRFPKSLRLKKNFEFRRLAHKGKRLFGSCLVADYLCQERIKETRLGLTVSKKFGKAHERNRFKRFVREAFRLHQYDFPGHLSINIRPQQKGKESLSFERVEQDMKRFSAKISQDQGPPSHGSPPLVSKC